MTQPWRLLLLGERRIAQHCALLLATPAFRDKFSLPVFVTNREFYDAYLRAQDSHRPAFIANDARRAEEISGAIAAHNINLLISVQHNWVLPASILDQVGGHAFNLHNAKLPDYKGYHSISHALWRGDTTFISSLHWMAPRVDSGDIVYEGVTPVAPDDLAVTLYLRTVTAATAAFAHLLRDLAADRTPPRRPMQGKGIFYGRDSLAALKQATPNEDPVTLQRRARAVYFPPHPPAWIMRDGQKLAVIPEIVPATIPDAWHNANHPDWNLPQPDVNALLAAGIVR